MEDRSKVDKEQVQAKRPAVGLLGGALDVYVWGGLLEERWCDVESHAQLAEGIVDHGGRLGWSEV